MAKRLFVSDAPSSLRLAQVLLQGVDGVTQFRRLRLGWDNASFTGFSGGSFRWRGFVYDNGCEARAIEPCISKTCLSKVFGLSKSFG
jgi:hypothetical protein